MEIERMFLNSFSIEKKPAELIEAAGALKHEKRKNRIMHPQDHHLDEATRVEEGGLGTQQQIAAESKKPLLKIKVIINKTVLPELKKRLETDLVQQLDASHTTMASRKRMKESTKRLQLLSDLSFEKQLQKQSHKDFKKMESDHDTEKKKEEGAQQTPTQRSRKDCTPDLTKMIVATKPVQFTLPDSSPQKQSNCSAITRPMQKTTQNSAVARPRPMQKETQSISDVKKKFESSKRKFEERLAEQREAKRRIVMVDFHHMPKPANDSRAPKRHCWGRKRF